MKKLTKAEVEAQARIILRAIEDKHKAARLAKIEDPAFKKAIEDLHKKHGLDKINKILKAQGHEQLGIEVNFKHLTVYLDPKTRNVLSEVAENEYDECIIKFLGTRNYENRRTGNPYIEQEIQDELIMASVTSKSLEKLTEDIIDKY